MAKSKKLKTNAEIIDEKANRVAKSDDLLRKLENLLDKQPALIQKIIDAIECNRYFITVTIQKKDSPEDKNDLKHFWTRQGLSANDITGSLRHLLKDYNSKENPNAMVDEATGVGLY